MEIGDIDQAPEMNDKKIQNQTTEFSLGWIPCTVVFEDPSCSQGNYEISGQNGQCSSRVGIPYQKQHPLLLLASSDDQLFCKSEMTEFMKSKHKYWCP